MTDITLTQPDLLPENLELENLEPDISHLVTEDDEPVDLLSEKQHRLLIQALYHSWSGVSDSIGFLAAANVGIFTTPQQPPIVPDVFLSIDVEPAKNLWEKRHRSYLLWEFGKPPEVVIEIVLEGNKKGINQAIYARMHVTYYVIFDPTQQLSSEVLQVLELRGREYVPVTNNWLEGVELGLCLWKGVFESVNITWLRWCDAQGNVIPTGAERAEQEKQRTEQENQSVEQAKQRAEQEKQRADQEKQRAEQEKQRADRLAAQLIALGIEPEE